LAAASAKVLAEVAGAFAAGAFAAGALVAAGAAGAVVATAAGAAALSSPPQAAMTRIIRPKSAENRYFRIRPLLLTNQSV